MLDVTCKLTLNTSDRQRREDRRGLPGCIANRNRTLLQHIGLAHHAARQQCSRGPDDLDDLIQEASIGAMAAVERFDPHRGHKPSSYIVSRARGQILHFRRDRSRTMRVPWRISDLISKVERVQAARISAGQPPLREDCLARQLGVSRDRLQQCQRVVHAASLVSLDQKQGKSGERARDRIDSIATPGPEEDPQLDWLRGILCKLKRRDQRLLEAYFVGGESLTSLSKRFKTDVQQLKNSIHDAVCLLRQWAKRDSAFG